MKDCLTLSMWHTKNTFFREMQYLLDCYTVVSYQALFRLSVYKIPAVYLLGAKNVCFCTIRDFGSPTNHVDVEERIDPEVIKLFPFSTQLSTNFILLISVKMPTIVDILTFISMINTTSERLKARNFFICRYFTCSFISS